MRMLSLYQNFVSLVQHPSLVFCSSSGASVRGVIDAFDSVIEMIRGLPIREF